MRRGHFEGLLLAVLLAASTLHVAVEARRPFNKCCARNEHLYYNDVSSRYECKTVRHLAERAAGIANGEGATITVPSGAAVDYVGVVNSIANLPGSTVDDFGAMISTTDFPRNVAVDADAEFGKFLAKLSTVSNDSFTRDDVVAGVIPSCALDDTDWLFAPGFRLRTTPDAVTLRPSRLHEFPAHAWCVDRDDEDDLAVVLCPCADASQPCVRKCCGRREALDKVHTACFKADVKPWTPTINLTYYLLVNKIPRDPTCEHHSIESFKRSQLTILSDGSMKGRDRVGRDTVYKPGRYCIDVPNATDASTTNDTDGDGDQLVLYCVEVDKLSDAVTIFKGVVTLLGAFALLITVVLTAIFPELRQSINGKMALCHNASLLGAFICIGFLQLSSSVMGQVSCKVLSFVIQYTLLAAFFWLNAMCIEVSWVFGALRPVQRVSVGHVDTKFKWYSLYAWGTTSLISVITMLVEFLPGAKLKPRFGEAQCFFHGDYKIPQLLFLFGPMAILLAINLGLFIFTATKIILHRRQTSILKTSDSNTNNRNKQNLNLYLKLFTLMGVTWVFEIISWAVGGKNYYWLAIDCVNLLRGVFIFFIFCFKRTVLDLVRARLGWAGAAAPPAQTSAGTKPTAMTNDGFEMTEAATAARKASVDPR